MASMFHAFFSRIGEQPETATRLFLNCTEEGLGRAMDFVNQYDEVRDSVEVLQLMKVNSILYIIYMFYKI